MATDILDDIEALARRHGPAALDAGMVHLRDSRIANSEEGRAALGVVDALVDRYGDDAIEWIFRRARARLERRRSKAAAETHAAIDADAERALERIKAGNGGDGHQ